jgi:signal transduction histidine kinase
VRVRPRLVAFVFGKEKTIAGWLEYRKQRLLYALTAVAMLAAVAATTVGGVLLRHAANVERQALRTQELAAAVVQLHGFSLRLEVEGPTAQLKAAHERALQATDAAFLSVRAHDRSETDRFRRAYRAYIEASTRAYDRAAATGSTSLGDQGQVEQQLSRFQSLINVELRRLAHETRVSNPRARMALIAAAVAALLLVVLLIWQFELQRRSGRIDRDNAASATELSRLREDFVAAVSHELRTPLTSIIGYVDLIQDETENLTAEQQAHLAVVQRNADRLHDLVGELLLIAEANEGALGLEIADVDIDELARESVESAQPAASAREIELTFSGDGRTRIEGDPIRLEQMMANLVTNAIKFTPLGGRVVVRTAREDGNVLFEVTDTGAGISAEDQPRLFERFFRARSAVDQAIRGTGLGLAITKAIVDAHHGSITVESAVGEGSTFRVRLPVTQESSEAGR